MPSSSRVRLLLLFAVGLSVLVFRFLIVRPDWAWFALRDYGYWAIAIISIVSVLMIRRAFRGWRFKKAVHLGPLAIAIGMGIAQQVHEPRMFRVTMDEYVLAATSMHMHLDREAWVPTQAQYISGQIFQSGGYVDKRPQLFPFLVSLIHDVSGYRVSNVYVFNFLASVGLFWLSFWVGNAIGGRIAGYCAVVLLGGIPLIANVATSGAYDLLNMALLAGILLASVRYLDSPNPENQNLLVVAGVMAAQCRYESILFLVPLAIVVMVAWFRLRRIEITTFSILSPLMLVPPLLSNLVYLSHDGFFENKEMGIPFFGLRYVTDNLGHAAYFLFNWSRHLTNSPLVSYAGCAALLFLAVSGYRLLRSPSGRKNPLIAIYAFSLAVAASFAMIMANFWGQFDDNLASRFSLPLHLLLVFAIIAAVEHGGHWKRGMLVTLWISCAFFFAWTIPTSAKAYSTADMIRARQVDWIVKTVLKEFDNETLVITGSSVALTAYQRPTVQLGDFEASGKVIWGFTKHMPYKQIVVSQVIKVDPETGEEKDVSKVPLPPSLKLKPLFQTVMEPNIFSRLSAIVGYDETLPDKVEPASPKSKGPDRPDATNLQ